MKAKSVYLSFYSWAVPEHLHLTPIFFKFEYLSMVELLRKLRKREKIVSNFSGQTKKLDYFIYDCLNILIHKTVYQTNVLKGLSYNFELLKNIFYGNEFCRRKEVAKNWTFRPVCFRLLPVTINCCIFQPAFGCCAPKNTGWNMHF